MEAVGMAQPGDSGVAVSDCRRAPLTTDCGASPAAVECGANMWCSSPLSVLCVRRTPAGSARKFGTGRELQVESPAMRTR